MALDELRDFATVTARHEAARAEIAAVLGPDLMAEITAARDALERAVKKLEERPTSPPGEDGSK